MKRFGTTLLVLLPIPAFAAGGIEVARGPDSTVYGSCVPSLVVENKSAETIDYLQVELLLTLTGGQKRTVELQSAYRGGVPAPIAPGAHATLKQHLDTSRAIGVQCSEVGDRMVGQTICEAGEKACAAALSVRP